MINKALVSIVISTAILTMGAVYFLEDRYFKCSEAKELAEKIEKESVRTFQSFQKSINTDRLQDLKDKRIIINGQLEIHPDNTYLKLRSEEIRKEIERLDEKLNRN